MPHAYFSYPSHDVSNTSLTVSLLDLHNSAPVFELEEEDPLLVVGAIENPGMGSMPLNQTNIANSARTAPIFCPILPFRLLAGKCGLSLYIGRSSWPPT